MPSSVPLPGYLPRVKADASGIEYVSVSEMLMDIASSAQPAVLPAGRLWLDTSAVPGAMHSQDATSETVAPSEARVEVLGAREARNETAAPSEAETDSSSSAGAFTEARAETVTPSEARAETVAAAEPRAETVTPSEALTDALAGGASAISLLTAPTAIYCTTNVITVPTTTVGDFLLMFTIGAADPSVGGTWTVIANDGNYALSWRMRPSGAFASVDVGAVDDGEGGTYPVYGAIHAWRSVNASPFIVKDAGWTTATDSTAPYQMTGTNFSGSGAPSDSMLCMFTGGSPAASAVSGGCDSSAIPWALAYQATPNGAPSAPVITYATAVNAWKFTFVLRKA